MNSNEYQTLAYAEEDGIGVLTFNRPEQLNALSTQVLNELILFSRNIKAQKIKGLIVTGSGEKAFIAGADIKAMASMSAKEAEDFAERGQHASLLLEDLPFPVVAAVNGFALGGGLEMALSCDFILASENAVFGLPEVSLGLIPGFGGTQRLGKIIGRNRAKEMIFTGRMVKAAEALEMGLLLSSHSNKEDLLEACRKIINSAAKNSLNAIAVAKYVINRGADQSVEEGLVIEKTKFAEVFESSDMKEGTQAFLEKRKPQFKKV